VPDPHLARSGRGVLAQWAGDAAEVVRAALVARPDEHAVREGGEAVEHARALFAADRTDPDQAVSDAVLGARADGQLTVPGAHRRAIDGNQGRRRFRHVSQPLSMLAMVAPTGDGTRAFARTAPPGFLALLVMVLYAAFVVAYLADGHDIRDFIRIGPAYINKGDGRSREIHLDRGYRPPANQNPATPGQGYDGQFAYYIALDPVHARYYLDDASYRYSRILYPITARATALGQRGAIPWTLLLINLLAIGGGAWGLGTWLRRRGASAWWAVVYGLWPGMVIALQRDLTEPLGYGLTIAGILALDGRGRWRVPTAGVAFGLAGLARQTTLVFPIILGLSLLMGAALRDRPQPTRTERRWRALVLLGLSLGPYAAYWIFLHIWLGGVSNGGTLTPVPFGGLLHPPYRLARQGIDLAFIVGPTLVILAVLLVHLRRSRDQPAAPPACWLPWSLLAANVLLNIVFYARSYLDPYTGATRQASGIVLSALLCLPCAAHLGWRQRQWLLAATAVAMLMLPVVVVYGFTNVSA